MLCLILPMMVHLAWGGEGDVHFAHVQQRARHLAAEPYRPSPPLPNPLDDLDYDDYRLIAFEHEQAIWKRKNLPFWLECFHRGYLYRDRVTLNLIEQSQAKRLSFDKRLFQYRGHVATLQVDDDIGFAGFRVLGRFPTSPHPLEIASFLGASYFRAIGPGQVYGTSARGLAVDIGLPEAEEFPVFREFWIEQAMQGVDRLRVWALLDSTSVTGAYQFTLRPSDETTVDVVARLYFRRQPKKLGIAPLTSMWMWGDGRAAPSGESRPEVHDADGLLVHAGDDDWIWRPLTRLDYPSLSRYDLARVRGFGLIQRDRQHDRYRDDEAKYHLRPSVWIEPKEPWSSGAIELLELPADHEGVDNIAAWYVPDRAVSRDEPLDLQYRVTFCSSGPPRHRLGRCIDTDVRQREPGISRIDIIFQIPESGLDRGVGSITPRIDAQRGRVSDVTCNELRSGVWRVSFDVRFDESQPVELEAVILEDGRAVTETWRYLCPK